MTETSATSVIGFDLDVSGGESHEQLRQYALEELGLIDTDESEDFDRITRMAGRLFDAPIAAVSLTDRSRQWFKSHVGTAGREIPRCGAPCAEVTRSQKVLNIPNLLEDERFADCLLARTGIRFYAGTPLTTRNGYTLGAMCVLDTKPREISAEEIRSLEDFAAMVMVQIEFQREAGRIDASSGLPNRHQLYDDMEDQKRRTPGASRVLLLVELADLRHVNDAVSVVGASYLDALIKSSAAAVREALGGNRLLYQVGFASIALLIDEQQMPLAEVARTLIARLKVPMLTNGIPVVLSTVLGASPFELGAVTPQNALRTAISAARQARQLETEFEVYSMESDAVHRRRFHIISQVRGSLEREDHLSLVYQPRLDLRTGVCRGAEALLRWNHPELGRVSPGEFIPLVEQTALARPVTQWVLSRAFQQIQTWRAKGLRVKLSINVSARNLEDDDFADLLAKALLWHDIQPDEIELEFTESAMIRFQSRVLAQLEVIRKMGVELAIDDFGTGYSSFAYLRQLPAQTVKLDQSFMLTLVSNAKDQAMVRSMIAMAQDMGYRVVGEGVETQEVLDLLQSYGCDEAQGYWIAKPLTAEGFEEFLRQQVVLQELAA